MSITDDLKAYKPYYLEVIAKYGKEWVTAYSKTGKKDFPLPIKPYLYRMSKEKTEYRDAQTHRYVKKVECTTTSQVRDIAWNHTTWEGDVPYIRRIMMDMDIQIVKPRIAYVDIETYDLNGSPDASAEINKILCIGVVYDDGKEVYYDGDEAEMIEKFTKDMQNVGMIVTYNGGTDVWSSRSFDLPYIADRYEVCELGSKAEFDSRMRHCDFVDLYLVHKRETGRIGKSIAGGYGLDNVCMVELGVGKIPRHKKVAEMEAQELREYNMRDVLILKQFDEKMKYTALRISLAQISNLCLVEWYKTHKHDTLNSLSLVDNLCIKECNKNGLVCKTKEYIRGDVEKYEGAYVIEPISGLHTGVQNYDIMQMYPTIIIENSLSFDKDKVVVINIIKDLMRRRRELKAIYNKTKKIEDFIIQYNLKVLANSIYGAYGNQYFRYYNRDMARKVTYEGEKLLKKIKKLVEGVGYKVLYGDTDSVFVANEKSHSDKLVNIINKRCDPYKVESGEYYENIAFVSKAGGNVGAKKRYAGRYYEDGIEKFKFVGFEFIKRSSTMLGREFLMSMSSKILSGGKYKDIIKCMNNFLKAMQTGKYDEYLVLSTGVKTLREYSVDRKYPIHVRALEKLVKMGYQNNYDVEYVYTNPEKILKKKGDHVNGLPLEASKIIIDDVMPVINGVIPKNIDYKKYAKQVERSLIQLLNPLAESEGIIQVSKDLSKGANNKMDSYF